MNRLLRLLLPSVLAVALLGALALAATASAEVRTGEASSPADPSLPGETDLLHASASYDSHTGTAVFEVTSREAPEPESKVATFAGLATVQGPCDASVSSGPAYPTLLLISAYEDAETQWRTIWQASESEAGPGDLGPGSWSLEGATVTLAASATPAISRPYNCAVVSLVPEGGSPFESPKTLIFPIAVKPVEPVTPAEPKPAEPVVKTVTVTPPAAAPGKLEIAKSKALGAKADQWTKASVKVTNSGGTAVGPVAIKAKGPAGVEIQPAQIKVPALLPGQSWTVNFRVKPSADAKPKSTITVAATGAGLTAHGSVVVKLAG